MIRTIIMITLLLPMVACVPMATKTNKSFMNIDPAVAEAGADLEIVAGHLQEMNDEITDIISKNYSLDDTFVFTVEPDGSVLGSLIPTMKKAGLRVVVDNTGKYAKTPGYYAIQYTFTGTNNHLIETPDVALCRVWVGEDLQISKAFVISKDGFIPKTAVTVQRSE